MKVLGWIVVALFLSSCSYHVEKTPEQPTAAAPTNLGFADVNSLILSPKCGHCHGNGFVGSYEATRALLDAISARIQSSDSGFMMPPSGNPALSPSEKAALLQWVAQGGPREAGGSASAPGPVPAPSQPEQPPAPPALNFASVSGRIFQPKCLRCHKTDLDTFEHTKPLLKEIEFRVQAFGQEEQMPPPNKPQLTEEELKLLLDWIHAGAPEL